MTLVTERRAPLTVRGEEKEPVLMGFDIGMGKDTIVTFRLEHDRLTYFRFVHGRPPLWSNNTLGAQEAQRYARRKKCSGI